MPSSLLPEPQVRNLNQILSTLGGGKYIAKELEFDLQTSGEIEENSLFHSIKKFSPLVTTLSCVMLLSLAPLLRKKEMTVLENFLNNFMGYFFVCFSFLKMINIGAFADSFSLYDPIASKFRFYGLLYPFIEMVLGLSFIFRPASQFAANIATIAIMSEQSIGVWSALRSGRRLTCACLGGSFFKLPMTYVTLFENASMIIMAIICLMFKRRHT